MITLISYIIQALYTQTAAAVPDKRFPFSKYTCELSINQRNNQNEGPLFPLRSATITVVDCIGSFSLISKTEAKVCKLPKSIPAGSVKLISTESQKQRLRYLLMKKGTIRKG